MFDDPKCRKQLIIHVSHFNLTAGYSEPYDSFDFTAGI